MSGTGQVINLAKDGQVINLSKGQIINLKKEDGTPVTRIVIGLGWIGAGGKDVDLDAYVRQYKGTDKYNKIYYGNKHANGVLHHGDDLVGGGHPDDPNEVIDVDLLNVDAQVSEMDFGVNIFGGAGAMKDVTNTFIVIYDENTKKELIRYDMAVDFATASNVVAAKVKRTGADWQLIGVGEGDRTGTSSLNGFPKQSCDRNKLPTKSRILSRGGRTRTSSGSSTGSRRNWFMRIIDAIF